MRLPKEQFIVDAYYHLYNHSAKGQLLFRSSADYEYCTELLIEHLSPDQYTVHAYCLMPNHYHLLIQQLADKPIPQAFFHIWNKYAKHYNKTYGEFGSVFCHKLQHVMVKNNPYLQTLIAYIHMNPVNAGLVADPGNWYWSDYLSWIGEQKSGLFNSSLRDSWYARPELYRKQILEISYEKLGKELLLDG